MFLLHLALLFPLLPVLCPEPLLPCGQRQGKHYLRLRQSRSLALWHHSSHNHSNNRNTGDTTVNDPRTVPSCPVRRSADGIHVGKVDLNVGTGDQTVRLRWRADDRRNSDESQAVRYRVPLSNTLDSRGHAEVHHRILEVAESDFPEDLTEFSQ